jgi:hypothetical protein
MKEKKLSIFVILLLLTVFSFACSLFPRGSQPTPEPTPYWDTTPAGPLMIEPASLPDAQKGVMYDAEIHITQNVTPVGDISIKDGTLPAGLELVYIDGETTAKVSGVPEETGTFSFTIDIWCYGTMMPGQTLEKDYQIVVRE